MHGLVALDAERRVLRPAILWNDQRTAAECAEIEDRIGLERLIELTGNRALPGFTAPKLLWLRRHEPEIYEQIAPRAAAEGLRAAPALRRAGDGRRGRVRDAPVRRRRPQAGARRCSRRSRSRPSGCRRSASRPRSPAPVTRRPAQSGWACTSRACVRRARDLRRRLRRRSPATARIRWAGPTFSAMRCRAPGMRWA